MRPASRPRTAALRRAVLRHRALLAAGLAAGSVAAALSALTPAPPPTVAVVVAAHDLAGGAPLGAADLRVRRLPAALLPVGALPSGAAAAGRVLAAPVRAGEVLTDVRLVGPALVDGGLVAAPVRIADAAEVGLLRVGDRVDVLAAPTSGGAEPTAVAAATDVRVLALPTPPERDLVDGALVVLATSPAVAADLATAAVHARLSLVLRGAA